MTTQTPKDETADVLPVNPAYMKWHDLRDMLWKRLRVEDEQEDDDLVASRAEIVAVLSWAQNFDRAAQPRRDEEQATYDIIRRGAELIGPGEGEAVFTIRVGGERTHLSTQAKSIEPARAVSLAMDVLKAEAAGLDACPAHRIAALSDRAAEPFQSRVQPWLMACFGEMIAGDREERNHRFLEEALELVQACECSASEAHQLVDYVYGRPIGEPAQEVGGVMVTLAALCLANDLDMHDAAETELVRIWTKVEAIRAKQAAKPKHSPLPAADDRAAEREGEDELLAWDWLDDNFKNIEAGHDPADRDYSPDEMVDAFMAGRATLRTERNALSLRLEAVEGALRPFADGANGFDGIPPAKYFGDIDFVLRYYDDEPQAFMLGQCRAARAALATTDRSADSECDDGPCTDCDDTGITGQTERACSCDAGDEYRTAATTGGADHG